MNLESVWKFLGFFLFAAGAFVLSLQWVSAFQWAPLMALGLVAVTSLAFKNLKLTSLIAMAFVALAIEMLTHSVLLSTRLSLIAGLFLVLAVSKKQVFFYRTAAAFLLVVMYLLFLDSGAVSSAKAIAIATVFIGVLFYLNTETVDQLLYIFVFVSGFLVVQANFTETRAQVTFSLLGLVAFFFITSRIALPFKHTPSEKLQSVIREVSKLGLFSVLLAHSFPEVYPLIYATTPAHISSLTLFSFLVLYSLLLFPENWRKGLLGPMQILLNVLVLVVLPFSVLNTGMTSVASAAIASGVFLIFLPRIQKKCGLV